MSSRARDQVLVLLEDLRAVPMERGSTLVALEEVTEDRILDASVLADVAPDR